MRKRVANVQRRLILREQEELRQTYCESCTRPPCDSEGARMRWCQQNCAVGIDLQDLADMILSVTTSDRKARGMKPWQIALIAAEKNDGPGAGTPKPSKQAV